MQEDHEEKIYINSQMEGNILKMAFIIQDQQGNWLKFLATLDLDQQPLSIFCSPQNLLCFMQNHNNYQIDFDRAILILRFSVVAEDFQTKSQTFIHLSKEELSKIDFLQFQNFLLKKAIQKFHTSAQISTLTPCQFQQNHEIGRNSGGIKIQYVENKIAQAEVQHQQKEECKGQEGQKDEKQSLKSNKTKAIEKKRRSGKKPGRQFSQNEVQIKNQCLLSNFGYGIQTSKKQIEDYLTTNNINQYPQRTTQQTTVQNAYKNIQMKKQKKKRGRKKKVEEENQQQLNCLEDQIQKEQNEIKEEDEQQIIQKQLESNEKIRIDFINGDSYLGHIEDYCYSGKGIYSSQQLGVYEGQWKNGVACGNGVSIDVKGNKHVGQYQNGKKNGNGIQYYYNQDSYEGNFKDNLKNGFGVYKFHIGHKYSGEWKDDLFDGHGILFYSDEVEYQGEWKCDKKHGKGILKKKQGLVIFQQWEDNKLVKQNKVSQF